MGKKSIRFIENYSLNTRKGYSQTIRKYEKFHGTNIESLINEALNEQTERIPEHELKIIDRIEEFQQSLIDEDLVYGTIQIHISRIRKIYRVNRVNVPYITPLNPKRVKRREYIEYKDILTKEEIKCALSHMRLPAQARTLVMAQGGLSNEECEHLTLSSFIEETKMYHQCDDTLSALEWLSDENHPIIWVTKLIRVKTMKPYYAIIGAEAVNMIAKGKLYAMQLPKYKASDRLFDISKQSFTRLCKKVNDKCGFPLIAEESKFRSHNLRRFHATHINGSVLTYEEHSRLSNSEIDELQGRGKTATQDTYIKTNPLQQKLLYAKVMNNVSLFNEYDYILTDDDVEIFLVDQSIENQKLKQEVQVLTKKLEQKNQASEKVKQLRQELGEDVFKEMIQEIIGA